MTAVQGVNSKSSETMLAMGHNLWLHFGVDEHPFATFEVHQGFLWVLTHSHGLPGAPHITKVAI